MNLVQCNSSPCVFKVNKYVNSCLPFSVSYSTHVFLHAHIESYLVSQLHSCEVADLADTNCEKRSLLLNAVGTENQPMGKLPT